MKTTVRILIGLILTFLAGCAPATAALPPETATPLPAATETSLPPTVTNTHTTTPTPLPPTRAATITPAPSSTPTLGPVEVSFEGVSFVLPAAVASQVETISVPENKTAEYDISSIYPAHTRFILVDYPWESTIRKPVIAVFPSARFRELHDQANYQLEQLSITIVRQKDEQRTLPMLPVQGGTQVFHSNEAFLAFQNGEGVRFLAQFGQYPAPPNNNDLFYTFQGLTTDRKYVVSVIVPISHPSLPKNDNAQTPADYETWKKDPIAFIQAGAVQLEAQPPESFFPSLLELDALVQSIAVQK